MHTQQDHQFITTLTHLLPEVQQLLTLFFQIQKQLMKDIHHELDIEFHQQFIEQSQLIQSRAEEEYNSAVKQLQTSRQQLLNEQSHKLQCQISTLEQFLTKIKEQHLLKLQQKYLQQNFQTIILNHTQIKTFENQLESLIYEDYIPRHEHIKQRQLKQLIISLQNKQIKLRKQLDKQIKLNIYESNGIHSMKEQIKSIKVNIGSLRSEYNLKVKKIEDEIKEYQKKIEQYQKVEDVEVVKSRFEQVKMIKSKENYRQNMQAVYVMKQIQADDDDQLVPKQGGLDDSLDQSENQVYKNNLQQKEIDQTKKLTRTSKLPYSKYPLNVQESSSEQNREQDRQIINNYHQQRQKIDLSNYLKNYMLESHTARLVDSVQNIKDINRTSLFNFENVTQLLKEKMAMDPLQKYINKETEYKQNNPNQENNCKQSNFATVYAEHLKRINQNLAKKQSNQNPGKSAMGLSDRAKKTIMKNLAEYHKQNYSRQAQIIMSIQETNLLTSSFK